MRLYSIWRRGLLPSHHGRLVNNLGYLLPPVVMNVLRNLLSEWEYIPGDWKADRAAGLGWRDASVAKAQEAHWPVLVGNLQGTAPLGVSHHPHKPTREDRGDHNTLMSFGYVLARAAREKDRISILDWGGSLGHYYLYSQALLPEVPIEYHCHDVPGLCALGRRLLPQAHFHDVGEDAFARRYDLVISSSSLHYFEDWRATVRQLAAATSEFLYIARLQTTAEVESFVVIQRPYHRGYCAEYLSWFINRQELVSCMEEAGMELLREFLYAEDWFVRGAPGKGDSRGFLFRRRAKTQGTT